MGVWIETSGMLQSIVGFLASHPAWVCGLKLLLSLLPFGRSSSHPAWVCGLKLTYIINSKPPYRHTLRGCVDWNRLSVEVHPDAEVTPCVGVWIETTFPRKNPPKACHTLRGCVDWNFDSMTFNECAALSHPAWVCGLKQGWQVNVDGVYCHTLRGCVDWNLLILSTVNPHIVTPCVGVWIETSVARLLGLPLVVTPCVGVWIETSKLLAPSQIFICHTLRGCVDWNNKLVHNT